jgi:hypothetical protein
MLVRALHTSLSVKRGFAASIERVETFDKKEERATWLAKPYPL